MNSNPCPEYAFDLAAAAGNTNGLSSHIAQHLQNCPHCRAAFAEFNEAALAHEQMASSLADPILRPRRDRPWAERNITRGRSRLTPASWLALGTALVAFMVFGSFRSVKSPKITEPVIGQSAPDRPLIFPAFSCTWGNLRQEFAAGETAAPLARVPLGVPLAQYRLKDAYFETD